MDYSIVIPLFNEAGNVGPVVSEIMHSTAGDPPARIVLVDDASTDDTAQVMRRPDDRLLLIGHRTRRRDTWRRRAASRIANAVRGWLLHDTSPDTGCGLKAFSREFFLQLPYFDHMHRFMPALTLQ